MRKKVTSIEVHSHLGFSITCGPGNGRNATEELINWGVLKYEEEVWGGGPIMTYGPTYPPFTAYPKRTRQKIGVLKGENIHMIWRDFFKINEKNLPAHGQAEKKGFWASRKYQKKLP